MSGVDVAGLAFAVLPVLIGIVQSYSFMSESLDTFRKSSSEARLLLMQLRVQQNVFITIAHHLLRKLGFKEKDVRGMLDDPRNSCWGSNELGVDLNVAVDLQPHLRTCILYLQDMVVVLTALERDLKTFDDQLVRAQNEDSFGRTFKGLRNAFRLALKKPRYQRSLQELRNWNTALAAFVYDHDARAEKLKPAYKIPYNLEANRVASTMLHEALRQYWRCSSLVEPIHHAKLCIEVQTRAATQFRLAITCEESADSHSQQSPTWLYVQSISVPSVDASQDVARSSIDASQAFQDGMGFLPSRSKASPAGIPTSNTVRSRMRAKLKPERKLNITHLRISDTSGDSRATVEPLQVVDLRHKVDLCQYVVHASQATSATNQAHCLGYLETGQTHKHAFYLNPLEQSTTCQGDGINAPSRSISDFMRRVDESTLTHEFRLKLARKTVFALLQFYNTPWLSTNWQLEHVQYFGSKDILDDKAMQSLHLSSDISAARLPSTSSARLAGSPHEAIHSGVFNTAIFSLGRALSEIGRWELVEDHMREEDQGNEIAAARRLAHKTSGLGPEYERLTLQCLRCNFGLHNTDLQDERLRTALYNDVLCRLDAMIEYVQSL